MNLSRCFKGLGFARFFAAVSFALVLSACSGIFDSSKRITLKLDDGDTVCNVGDVLVISLDSNPTTGYDWTPASYNSSILKLESRKFVKTSKFMRKAKNMVATGEFEAETLVGAPGVTEISFVAQHAGESEIKLEYSRPWEGKSTREAIFKIKVLEDLD